MIFSHVYHLSVDDLDMGMKVAKVLSENREKSLLSIRATELPTGGE